jgi:type IX secretion system PorP/SprF family membrane protein
MNKKTIAIVMVICSMQCATAQVNSSFTQNQLITPALNPAMQCAAESMGADMLYRKAWMGESTAPQLSFVQLHMPLMQNKMGVGVLLNNEVYGNRKLASFMADGAYAIKIGEGHVAFGLRLGMQSHTNTLSGVNLIQPDDPNFKYDYRNIIAFNGGFGISYFSNKWRAGASVPSVMETNIFQNSNTTNIDQQIKPQLWHTYVHASRNMQITNELQVQLGVAGRTIGHRIPYAQASAIAQWNKMLMLGISYQYNHSISAIVGYTWQQKIAITYSYDWVTNKMMVPFGGSHELRMAFFLIKAEKAAAPVAPAE